MERLNVKVVKCRHCLQEIPAGASRCCHCAGKQRDRIRFVFYSLSVCFVLIFGWHLIVFNALRMHFSDDHRDMSFNPIINTVTWKIESTASGAELLGESIGVELYNKFLPIDSDEFNDFTKERWDVYSMMIPWKVDLELRAVESDLEDILAENQDLEGRYAANRDTLARLLEAAPETPDLDNTLAKGNGHDWVKLSSGYRRMLCLSAILSAILSEPVLTDADNTDYELPDRSARKGYDKIDRCVFVLNNAFDGPNHKESLDMSIAAVLAKDEGE